MATIVDERNYNPLRTRNLMYWVRKGGSLILTTLTIIVIGLVIAVTILPKLLNAVPLTVLTGSMEPTYKPGDVVVVQKTDPSDIKVGDVVSFFPKSNDPTLITHRVIGKSAGDKGIIFTTQGDANGAVDDPVKGEQIAGKVIYSVPKVGHITNMGNTENRGLIIMIIGGSLVSYGMFKIFSRSERKQSK